MLDEAITALREALAEQPAQTDWEAVAADQAMTIALMKAEQPAQQQEPVAIADGTFNHNCPIGTPLYTSPPAQRKPLTDDEFISMVDSAGIAIDPGLAFEIKKMVEAAHGIKE